MKIIDNTVPCPYPHGEGGGVQGSPWTMDHLTPPPPDPIPVFTMDLLTQLPPLNRIKTPVKHYLPSFYVRGR